MDYQCKLDDNLSIQISQGNAVKHLGKVVIFATGACNVFLQI